MATSDELRDERDGLAEDQADRQDRYDAAIEAREAAEERQSDLDDANQAADDAEAAHQDDPALGLRARILAQAAWVQGHPGIYKVMHDSKVGMPFKESAFTRITAAMQRCMDAGVAPPGDAATVALDLRTAVIGMLSLRINEPELPWPPFPPPCARDARILPTSICVWRSDRQKREPRVHGSGTDLVDHLCMSDAEGGPETELHPRCCGPEECLPA